MIVASVLTVGMGMRSDALKELPVRLLAVDRGVLAIRCLREERVDMVVSRWELDDMPHGILPANILAAKPFMPTIVFVPPGDNAREIAARSLGVSAVLSDDTDDDYLREAVSQILSISTGSKFTAERSGLGWRQGRNDFGRALNATSAKSQGRMPQLKHQW